MTKYAKLGALAVAGILFACIGGVVIVAETGSRPKPKARAVVKTPADVAKGEMMKLIKGRMNDPASFQFVGINHETIENSSGEKRLIVEMTYRGKNSFNAVVLESAIGDFSPDGTDGSLTDSATLERDREQVAEQKKEEAERARKRAAEAQEKDRQKLEQEIAENVRKFKGSFD